MRDIEAVLPPLPIEEKDQTSTKSIEVEYNWKSALEMGMCKSLQEIKAERSWAGFIARMREICPESNWVSICETPTPKGRQSLLAIQNWMESIVATPEWPFPEQVLIMSSGKKNNSWLILIPKSASRLPYIPSPEGIIITPWSDKHSAGWKIIQELPYNMNKAGEV